MNKGAILEVDSVILSYGLHRVLSNVYVRCARGHVTGLLGRNGSGKSSLLKVIFGSVIAESKSVRIDGVSLPEASFRHRQIVYLPQHALIPSNITLKAALGLFKIHPAVITDEYPELEKVLGETAGRISGGELRLLEVLLMLYSKSPFCLLDEPFSGLAPVMIERLKVTIERVKADKGIVITDHLHKHVTGLSDSLYLMDRGQTRRITHPDQLVQYGYVSALPGDV